MEKTLSLGKSSQKTPDDMPKRPVRDKRAQAQLHQLDKFSKGGGGASKILEGQKEWGGTGEGARESELSRHWCTRVLPPENFGKIFGQNPASWSTKKLRKRRLLTMTLIYAAVPYDDRCYYLKQIIGGSEV